MTAPIIFEPVTMSVQKVAAAALGLPVAGRAIVVEKLLESLSGKVDPRIERVHLDEIRQRRESVRSGKSKLVEGSAALSKVREIVR